MIRKVLAAVAFFSFCAVSAFAGSLDGKKYNVEFQADAPEKGTIAFENGMIVSSIHKMIIDGENAVQNLSGFQQIPVPAGVSYSGDEANFTGRLEGFPPIYWSGKISGSAIEGAVNVESVNGPYMIPFKGSQS